ncbi:MAG: hypothetical protein KGI11_01730 [Thaumarchaeota archaeon]|nr:hypothetical protein [Nitrososphaerota archaeon]
MTFKKYLPAIMAAALAVVVISPVMATSFESWQQAVSSSVVIHNKKTTLSVTASDNIPKKTTTLAGFAWFYKNIPNLVFVGVTHEGVVDSVQDPNGWHTHNVVLSPVCLGKEISGKCISKSKVPLPDYCIVHVTKDTFADLDIKGTNMTINVNNSELPDDLTGSAVGFSIVSEPDVCTGSGLGVLLDGSPTTGSVTVSPSDAEH